MRRSRPWLVALLLAVSLTGCPETNRETDLYFHNDLDATVRMFYETDRGGLGERLSSPIPPQHTQIVFPRRSEGRCSDEQIVAVQRGKVVEQFGRVCYSTELILVVDGKPDEVD